jgi:hypothetical protein
MKQCRALLNESNVDKAVRYGDIYGLMVEHYARVQQWKAVSSPVDSKCVAVIFSTAATRELLLFVISALPSAAELFDHNARVSFCTVA